MRQIEAEVLDLRTLSPLDTGAVIETARKTKRVVVVHESVQFAGFGGEIVSTIADSEAFYYLDAPIKRVGGLCCPVPFNPQLEESVFSTPEKVEAGRAPWSARSAL